MTCPEPIDTTQLILDMTRRCESVLDSAAMSADRKELNYAIGFASAMIELLASIQDKSIEAMAKFAARPTVAINTDAE